METIDNFSVPQSIFESKVEQNEIVTAINEKQENKPTFCIYKITNNLAPKNKIYIGKTCNFSKRIRQHFNNAFSSNKEAKKDCPKLYNSIRKYGKEAFTVEIIDQFEDENEAYLAEEKYVELFDSCKNGLNTAKGGKGGMSREANYFYEKGYLLEGDKNPMYGRVGELNPFYGKEHSKEIKEYLSKINKGKYSGEKNYFYGKHFTGEKHPRCTISEETAKKIIEHIKEGKATKEIKKIIPVSKDIINNIKYTKTWKHLPR